MIEQNPVLKALNLEGSSQGTTESVDERQLLPKLKGSFAEVLSQAAGKAPVDSENGAHLGATFISDIQVDRENLAKQTGVIASWPNNDIGLSQMALIEGGGTDLDTVMQQIHLPQETKLPTLPTDTMKPVSSVNTLLDIAAGPSKKSPGLAENMDSEIVETADALMQSTAEKMPGFMTIKTDAKDKEEGVNPVSPIPLEGAQTAGESPGEASETTSVAEVNAMGLNDLSDKAVSSLTHGQEKLTEAAQDKDRAAMTSQTHAAQPKADGNVGKEMTEAKAHKPDSGTTNLGHSNTASSQSNQQGQSSFSGQQHQAQQQFMNQVQKQVVQAQQEAVKAANEASVVEAEKAEKTEKVLGNLGLGMEAKKTAGQSFSIGHPVRSPQWGQALGQKVTYMANNKIQEAKITLNPEKLGPIQVKLSLDKDQHAHVSMVTQHGTTRDAIENAMPRLKEMLEAAGVGFGSLDVRDERSSSEQNLANQDGQSSSGHAGGVSMDGDDAGMVEGTVQTVSSDNLVDFYA